MWNFHYFRRGADSDLYCMLMAEFGCGKGNPARSIWHGSGIRSESLAQTTIEKVSPKWRGTQTPLKSGLALFEARFEPEKILARKIIFSQPNWGVLDELY